METLNNPEEAIKINRLRKDLSGDRSLTQVDNDFALFEMATNKHFNTHMNEMHKLEGIGKDTMDLTSNIAQRVLNKINATNQR